MKRIPVELTPLENLRDELWRLACKTGPYYGWRGVAPKDMPKIAEKYMNKLIKLHKELDDELKKEFSKLLPEDLTSMMNIAETIFDENAKREKKNEQEN